MYFSVAPRGNATFNILSFTQTTVIAQFNIPVSTHYIFCIFNNDHS